EQREHTLHSLAGPADRLSVFGNLPYYTAEELRQHPVEAWIEGIAGEYEAIGKSFRKNPPPLTSTLQPLNPGTLTAHVLPGVRLLDAQFIETLSRRHGPSYFPDALSIAAWLG